MALQFEHFCGFYAYETIFPTTPKSSDSDNKAGNLERIKYIRDIEYPTICATEKHL